MDDVRGDLTGEFAADVARMDAILRPEENLDLVRREFAGQNARAVMYYLSGMTRSDSLEKLLLSFENGTVFSDARTFAETSMPASEAAAVTSFDALVSAVLSGQFAMLSDAFGSAGIVADFRIYPARNSEEPENDKVMRGSRDGFVETLLTNVSLIRRRIRTPDLTVRRVTAGKSTRTDIALVYLRGKADPDYVEELAGKIGGLRTDSLVMGHASIAESMRRRGWFNPFPKVRATERPDAAAATILEGGVIVLCDNSPEAMIFPTTLFHFLQETDDYYFSPLVGTYLRLLRHLIFWLTMIVTPLWLLALHHADILPPALHFVIPSHPGDLPILVQLIVTELTLDGLKLASLNTPNVLASSLSVVGGLLLGDFAVTVGWVSPDVILYMAFVSIANFTQSSYELGYAFKFLRMITLLLTAAFDLIGFLSGIALAVILAATNVTLDGRQRYLYPLIPFDGRALSRLILRRAKDD
ncbi:MAG: spore germination protein [Clostridiales bacterium]|nr:spore germination protein [Clostridiales bacterium]